MKSQHILFDRTQDRKIRGPCCATPVTVVGRLAAHSAKRSLAVNFRILTLLRAILADPG